MVELLNNQTFLDVAMQECGSADYALQIALFNGNSITKDLVAGDEVEVQIFDLNAKQKSIAYVLSRKENKPASNDIEAFSNNRGIGYMEIGTSFKVS